MSDFIFEHDLSEKFISIGPITVYWYSLMFLFAFWFGYLILKKIYIKENKDVKLLDPFLRLQRLQAATTFSLSLIHI